MTATVEVTKGEVLARLRAVLPDLAANVLQAEEDRALPHGSARALLDAGLARVLQPRRFGGYELGLDTWFEAVRQISAVDASHGWCASLIVHHSHYIAQFPEAAQEAVWADGPDVAIAGSVAPSCSVAAVDGGYRISGRSAYASGVGHSTWSYVGGFLPSAHPPAWALFLIPSSDYTVEQTWDTIGMRGTGSNTIVTSDVFVPEGHVLRVSDLQEGSAPGSAAHAAPYYRAPWASYSGATFLTPMLGAAQGALELFRARTESRARANGASVAGSASVQTRLARAAADVDAAQLLIERALTVAAAENKPDLAARARNLRDFGRASELIVGAIDSIMMMSGSGGFSRADDIQRFWRDIHFAASHAAINPESGYAHWGRMQFGLERDPSQRVY